MNWWAVSLLLLLAGEAIAQNRQFIIRGTISDAPIKVLYLRYLDYTGKEVLDSAEIKQTVFSFTGKINQPVRAILRANRKVIPDDENSNITPLYLEPTSLNVQLVYNHFKDVNVSGSKTHIEFERLKTQNAPFVNKVSKYIVLRDSLARLTQQNSVGVSQATSQHKSDSITKLIPGVVSQMQSVSYQFIKNHPDSWVSAYELSLWKSTWPIDSVRYLFSRLSPLIRKGAEGQLIANKIKTFDQAQSSISAPAADFSTTDLTGKVIRLADFRGQYVLLDFWGSWCAPCRAGNPHLLELYGKYHQRGIEFIGIACEDKPTAWRKAVEKDGIGIWKHILDTEVVADKVVGKEKSIMKQYAVDLFPTKILIDPSGIIVGRYKGGDETEMDKKFNELFEQK